MMKKCNKVPRHRRSKQYLGDGVTAIHAQIGSGHVPSSVGEKICHGAHQIFRLAHLALGDQRCPVLVEVGVIVQDFLGPAPN